MVEPSDLFLGGLLGEKDGLDVWQDTTLSNGDTAEELVESAQLILEFLAEVEAGESAVSIINEFCFFRLYYAKVGVPRKMKPMFGSIEDPAKQKEYSGQLMIKAFRTHTFNVRGNPEIAAPAGWKLEDDENLTGFGELIRRQASLLDSL